MQSPKWGALARSFTSDRPNIAKMAPNVTRPFSSRAATITVSYSGRPLR